MAEASDKFAIRVGLDGGEAVQAGLTAIAQAGVDAMAKVQQSSTQAGDSLARFARTANDNAQQVSRLATSFSTFESNTKSVGRAVSDAAGALQLFGGAGTQAATVLNVVRSTLGGVADLAGATAGAFGATGVGLAGVLARFAGVVGVVVTAYQLGRAAIDRFNASAESATRITDRAREAIQAYQAAIAASNAILQTAEQNQRAQAAARLAESEAVTANAIAIERETLARANNTAARIAQSNQRAEEVGGTEGFAGPFSEAARAARQQAAREVAQQYLQAEARLLELERRASELRSLRNNPTQEQFGPPASLANHARERTAARQEAGALEESLNRLAAAAGQVRIPTEELQDAQRIIAATATPAERYASELQKLNEYLAHGSINQETFNRAVAQAQQTMERADGSAESLRRTGRELGLTFSSAFEDAIIKGKKLSDVLKGILEDIARIVLRRTVTEPLGGAISKLVEGIFNPSGGGQAGGSGQPGTATGGSGANAGGIFSALGSLIGSAQGNAFDMGRVLAFAKGGVLPGPVLFPLANGIGLAGEAGPEAVMPLRRGRDGRLGVSAEGGTAAAPISQTIHLDLRGSSLTLADVEARVRAGMRQANAELVDEIQRNPALAKRIRGR